jgi:hypothetical protein
VGRNAWIEFKNFQSRTKFDCVNAQDMMRFAQMLECFVTNQLHARGLSPVPIGAGVD